MENVIARHPDDEDCLESGLPFTVQMDADHAGQFNNVIFILRVYFFL